VILILLKKRSKPLFNLNFTSQPSQQQRLHPMLLIFCCFCRLSNFQKLYNMELQLQTPYFYDPPHRHFTTPHIVILRPHTSSFTTPHIVILRPTTSTLFFLENLHYDPPHRHFTTPHIVILRPHTSSFYDPIHRHFTTPYIVILRPHASSFYDPMHRHFTCLKNQ
jgi:hypothetical protein